MVQIIGFDIDSRLPTRSRFSFSDSSYHFTTAKDAHRPPSRRPPPRPPRLLRSWMYRTPEYIVDQEMWQELQKQATTSVLLTTVRDSTASSTSPSSAAPTTTTTATSTTSSTTTTTTTTFYCPTMPTPWIYNPSNGHCYYVSTDRELMWQDAETNCRNLVTGARLASIGDEDENDFIYNMLGMGDYYWIGLQQLMGTNTFSSTGSWIDNSMYDYINGYSNWVSPPTMLMYDACAAFYGPEGHYPGMWYGYDCTQTNTLFLYICEVPAT